MAYEDRYTFDVPVVWASTREPLNIFYLDHDPRQAAQFHCDRHVVKMCVETAQILSTVWHIVNEEEIGESWVPPPPFGKRYQVEEHESPAYTRTLAGQRIYRGTHRKHPSVLWAAESKANYEWLWRLGMHLAAEYAFRYERQHRTQGVLWTLEAVPPALPSAPRSEPPAVMPEQFLYIEDGIVHAVPSYRRLYAEGKAGILSWKKREQPHWLEFDGTRWAATGLCAD